MADDIDRILDLLRRARRHVRSRVCEARDDVDEAVRLMERADGPALSARLAANLRAGLRCHLADPRVLEGYIDGACWEILAMGRHRRGLETWIRGGHREG
jgi:hypothetical protein